MSAQENKNFLQSLQWKISETVISCETVKLSKQIAFKKQK